VLDRHCALAHGEAAGIDAVAPTMLAFMFAGPLALDCGVSTSAPSLSLHDSIVSTVTLRQNHYIVIRLSRSIVKAVIPPQKQLIWPRTHSAGKLVHQLAKSSNEHSENLAR
jgi:hypothetical protein